MGKVRILISYMSSEGRTQSYLLSIWYQPSRTLRGLRKSGAGHGAALLVAGVFGFFNSARIYLGAEEKSFLWLFLGVFIGIGMLYLMAQLVRNFSRWFGGQANCRIVRVGLGLSLLPWTLLSGVLLYLLMVETNAERLQALLPVIMIGFIYGFIILWC